MWDTAQSHFKLTIYFFMSQQINELGRRIWANFGSNCLFKEQLSQNYFSRQMRTVEYAVHILLFWSLMFPLKWQHASSAKKWPTRETFLVKHIVVVNRFISNWQPTQLERAEWINKCWKRQFQRVSSFVCARFSIYTWLLWFCRSLWPRGLRLRSAAARLLRLSFRIPPGDGALLCVVR